MILGDAEGVVLRGERELDSTAVRPAKKIRSFMMDGGQYEYKL